MATEFNTPLTREQFEKMLSGQPKDAQIVVEAYTKGKHEPNRHRLVIEGVRIEKYPMDGDTIVVLMTECLYEH